MQRISWIAPVVWMVWFVGYGTAAEQNAPRAARSVHLWYPAPAGMTYYNELTVEESVPGSYFCVCGFKNGYFGIQELTTAAKLSCFQSGTRATRTIPTACRKNSGSKSFTTTRMSRSTGLAMKAPAAKACSSTIGKSASGFGAWSRQP